MKRRLTAGLLALVLFLALLSGCSPALPNHTLSQSSQSSGQTDTSLPDSPGGADGSAQNPSSPGGQPGEGTQPEAGSGSFSPSDVPAYSGQAYTPVNGNLPYFDPEELSAVSFESYGRRDSLGRCAAAFACVGQDLMPTQERGSIGQIKPTGWHTVKYDCVDGGYLYNRCHLIGYQLTGENANEDNLITGTRYLNMEGMLPFENLVADYVQETNNHVAYRVTPVFLGDNLLASGVLMEGYSLEDGGAGICYCVYAYNVQPGVEIDYATGDSRLAGVSESPQPDSSLSPQDSQRDYILNTSTKKFHLPGCSSVEQMNEANRQDYTGSRDDLIALGYSPCGRCKP